jgi:ubiquitin-like protein Pup
MYKVCTLAYDNVVGEANEGDAMSSQSQSNHSKKETDEVEAVKVNVETQERVAEVTAETDALLDAIEDVLEVNAEVWVKEFVQKGGQ